MGVIAAEFGGLCVPWRQRWGNYVEKSTKALDSLYICMHVYICIYVHVHAIWCNLGIVMEQGKLHLCEPYF